MRDDREEGEGGCGRESERERDAPDDRALGEPVHPGGVEQLGRHRRKGLAEKEDAEGGRDEGDDERGIGVDEAEPREAEEKRDRRDVERDEERREDEAEDERAPAEPPLRQRVGARHCEEDLEDEDRAADDRTVEEEAGERGTGERVRIVFDAGRRRQEVERRGEDLAWLFQGQRDHPEERDEHDECAEGEREDRDRAAHR